MANLREWLETPKGKVTSASFAGAMILLCGYFVYSSFGRSDPSGDRMFMDAGVNPPVPFRGSLSVGTTIPLKAPSGKMAGYPAEACFWTKDGQTKTDPTYVLLKQYLGQSGPTFCPDCGRLVVGHNPPPVAGQKPPPTEAEYNARPHRPLPVQQDDH